jgi:DNA helicase-2/ATP-dependent DNA helicase PcrA
VDFEDLIRLAIKALRADPAFLQRLAHRWPYILEDEAQDSSLLQEKILRLLADNGSSWVRVGDPNQAIYETFTTASPRYLRDFMCQKGVEAHDLPNSGRSTKSIIDLANHLITWTNSTHPMAEIQEALTPPLILPTPPGDPQPNPPDDPNGIHLYIQKLEPADEIQLIAKSIQRWIKDNSDKTVAVLVPRNERGAEMVSALQAAQIDCIELLQTSHSTRKTAKALSKIMLFFTDPTKSTSLAEIFKVFIEYTTKENPKNELLVKLDKEILNCKNVENFLAPVPGKNDLERIKEGLNENWALVILEDFHHQLHNWQRASLLPIDQFILTISMVLFSKASDLATAYKIANFLERASKLHPEWNFTDFTNQLASIASNRIKLIGFSDEDLGFDPDLYKGKVVISTVHKAKGLEWDRVYLLSVNNYDYPFYEEQDQFIAERWFIRDQLNLQAETLAALKSLVNLSEVEQPSKEGWATQQARLDYCAERLRLLYVGITRARKELIVTWNTGQRGQCYPATPLKELTRYWEEIHGTSN